VQFALQYNMYGKLTILLNSGSVDGNFHPRLAVTNIIADEVVLSLGKSDLIRPWLIHFGSSWSLAAIISSLVHGHHIVSPRAIIESWCTPYTKMYHMLSKVSYIKELSKMKLLPCVIYCMEDTVTNSSHIFKRLVLILPNNKN